MNFLAPLFLAGAAAVALPIVFHLIRRTSREKTMISSLMFLQPTPPRITRRSRLENIFLLLLRCLVLCLLALGFARPFLRTAMPVDGANGPGRRMVVLVDVSASMQREGLWAAAQSKVDGILRDITPNDSLALVAFDRSSRSLVSFEDWASIGAGERAALARQRLAEAKPGWGATHLGKALLGAVELLEDPSARGQGKETGGSRQIILVTDLQEGARLDGLQGFEWPRQLELRLEPVAVKKRTNAGLQVLAEVEDTGKTAGEFAARLRVSNASDSSKEQFHVAWAYAGEQAASGPGVDVYVPPGQSRVIAAPKLPPGRASDRLLLSGDEDAFDNAGFVVPPKPDQIKLLFLGNDGEKDSTQLLYFIRRALQETRRVQVQIVNRPESATLTAADLDGAPLTLVSEGMTPANGAVLREALQGGKTVFLVMKSPAAAQTIAALTGAAPPAAEEVKSSGYAMWSRIDFNHPLFAAFADPRYSDFTKIHFWRHRRLGTNALAGARVLAAFEGGDPALLELAVGKGTLLISTSGWQPLDSQWALSSKFVPLLYSILEQSGGIKAQLSQYTVGDDVVLPGSAGRVALPDGTQAEVPAGLARWSKTELPGVYTFTSQQTTQRFAVNLDGAESRTPAMSADELERLGLPLKHLPGVDLKKVEEKKRLLQAVELESRQKLWRWLILAALVVLLAETWLAGFLGRRLAPAEQAPAS